MRVFVAEWCVAGGTLNDATGTPWGPASLAAEGHAMLSAVTSDLADLPGITVETLRHVALDCLPTDPRVGMVSVARAADLESALDAAVARSDAAIVIAPEFDGHLEGWSRRVLLRGGRLLSCEPELIAWAADKHRTAEWLAARGLPAPRGIALDRGDSWPHDATFPVVIKPRFGAGSQGVLRIDGPHAWPGAGPGGPTRVEALMPGVAASVALLRGTSETVVLPPSAQRLSADGRFQYLGGSCPLAEPWGSRATRLGERVAEFLPAGAGYLGLDLVLGADPGGRDDAIIEINPRWTTSYVGLRVLARGNLMGAVLDLARGNSPRLAFQSGRVEFAPNGRVQFEAAAPATLAGLVGSAD